MPPGTALCNLHLTLFFVNLDLPFIVDLQAGRRPGLGPVRGGRIGDGPQAKTATPATAGRGIKAVRCKPKARAQTQVRGARLVYSADALNALTPPSGDAFDVHFPA